jgi:hypothetical protein
MMMIIMTIMVMFKGQQDGSFKAPSKTECAVYVVFTPIS